MVSDILKVGQGHAGLVRAPVPQVGVQVSRKSWPGNWGREFAQGFRPDISPLGGLGQIWHIDPIFGYGLGCMPGDGATGWRNRISTAMTAVDIAVREAGQDFIRDIIRAD